MNVGVQPLYQYLVGERKVDVCVPIFFFATRIMAIVKVINALIVILPCIVVGKSTEEVGHVRLVSGE